MIYWYFIYFGLSLASIILLLQWNLSYPQALLITFLFELIIYLVIAIIRSKIFSYLLDEACDPQRYLKWIRKQEKVMKRKPKLMAILSINEAAAYIVLGKFEEARKILDEIEKSYLSENNSTLLVYTINYIACCYELGDIDKAQELFDTQISVLSPFNTRYKRNVNILVGDRYYFMGKYDQSYEHLKKLLDIDLSRRMHLGILYRLAQIDDLRGDEELAQKKYRKIAQYGNKLWIAQQARLQIKDDQ